MANWYVRRLADQEIVYTIRVASHLSERTYVRILAGLLRHVDRAVYYVDTRESDGVTEDG